MEMIGHETVREYAHRQASAGVAQEGDECLKIAIGMKHWGAAIAAIDDVIAILSDGSPCSPRHGDRSLSHVGVYSLNARFYAE
jgi:hypothetical protein